MTQVPTSSDVSMGQLSVDDLDRFASEQTVLLKTMYRFRTNAELTPICIIKLQEEVGELADAYLAHCQLQRPEKLQRDTERMLVALGDEIADVVVVAAIIAHLVGLSLDDVISRRLEALRERRARTVESVNQQLADLWVSVGTAPDQLVLPIQFE